MHCQLNKMKQEIEDLRKKLDLQEFMGHISRKGRIIEIAMAMIPNHKYSSPVVYEYLGQYFIIYEIYELCDGGHTQKLLYYDEEQFETEKKAMMEYKSLLTTLKSAI
jgi:hypothetical protein